MITAEGRGSGGVKSVAKVERSSYGYVKLTIQGRAEGQSGKPVRVWVSLGPGEARALAKAIEEMTHEEPE